MKADAKSVRLLAEITESCLFEKGESFSEEQMEFYKNVTTDVELEVIAHVLPVERETLEKLSEMAESLGKSVVDVETILRFFGGDPHMSHVEEDLDKAGLSGILKSVLQVFHLVIQVEISEDNDQLVGTYSNGEVNLKLVGIEILNRSLTADHYAGKLALVHFGSVFSRIEKGSSEESILLEAQLKSDLFIRTCKKVRLIDCARLLRAFQYKKSKHSN